MDGSKLAIALGNSRKNHLPEADARRREGGGRIRLAEANSRPREAEIRDAEAAQPVGYDWVARDQRIARISLPFKCSSSRNQRDSPDVSEPLPVHQKMGLEHPMSTLVPPAHSWFWPTQCWSDRRCSCTSQSALIENNRGYGTQKQEILGTPAASTLN